MHRETALGFASFTGGAVGSVFMGAALASTPVGWFTAGLLIAFGSGITGVVAEEVVNVTFFDDE